MKKLILTAAVAASALIAAACASPGKTGGLMSLFSSSSVELPPYRVETLPNGLKIYFIRSEALPRVSLRLMLKVGARNDPAGYEGLTMLAGSLLDRGTSHRTATQLSEEFNSLGTELNSDVGDETSAVSASALTPQAEKLLDLFSDVILNPSFADPELRRERDQFKSAIRRRVDNPSSFAALQFNKYLFGDHPFGRDELGTPESLDKIKRVDLMRQYLAWVRPNNALMAVTGRYGPDFEKKVIETFSAWKKRDIKPYVSSDPLRPEGVALRLVSRPSLVQAQIRFGQIGVSRADPDWHAMNLAGEILGGGFAARLMQRLRDDLGLTYGISSRSGGGFSAGGFTISTSTRNDAVGKAIQEVLAIHKKFVDEGATEAELAIAKAQLIGQYPRTLETPDAVAGQLLVADMYGLPLSEITDYPRLIEKIPLSQVNDAIKRRLHGQGMRILVYGDKRAVGAQLQEWKPEIVDIK